MIYLPKSEFSNNINQQPQQDKQFNNINNETKTQIFTWKTPSMRRVKTTGRLGVHPIALIMIKGRLHKPNSKSSNGYTNYPTIDIIISNLQKRKIEKYHQKNRAYYSSDISRTRAPKDNHTVQNVAQDVPDMLSKFQPNRTTNDLRSEVFCKAVPRKPRRGCSPFLLFSHFSSLCVFLLRIQHTLLPVQVEYYPIFMKQAKVHFGSLTST